MNSQEKTVEKEVLNRMALKNDEEPEQGYEGMEENELDDEDLEAVETKKTRLPEAAVRRGRPAGTYGSYNKTPRPQQPPSPSQPPKSPAAQPRKRYALFAMPARLGVADAETGDVIGEGDTAVLSILADVLERLERIEDNIGSFTGK